MNESGAVVALVTTVEAWVPLMLPVTFAVTLAATTPVVLIDAGATTRLNTISRGKIYIKKLWRKMLQF